MPEPKPMSEIETAALREELAKCREEGRRQWSVAHSSECHEEAGDVYCEGQLPSCEWPMPKILEGE